MKPTSIQCGDKQVAAIGNTALLDKYKTGLFCSRKCPAVKILEAYDQFKRWAADSEITVISGFHSPVEKECFKLLLTGKANIILSPARELEHMRILKERESVIDEGRMLIISPFKEKRRRTGVVAKDSTFEVNLLYINALQ
ncbi:MAG: hypothetical protein PF904_17385 [Kiritimatiellae bacterium]|jgi:hypothetical protein|nr:hypothetical protein [Kiritimatiellia bacterium]